MKHPKADFLVISLPSAWFRGFRTFLLLQVPFFPSRGEPGGGYANTK